MPLVGTPPKYQPPSDNGPDPLPNEQFMPASPADTSMTDPNVGDQDQQDQWLQDNVYSKGWTVDGKTGEIYDPATDSVKGKVPTFYPRT